MRHAHSIAAQLKPATPTDFLLGLRSALRQQIAGMQQNLAQVDARLATERALADRLDAPFGALLAECEPEAETETETEADSAITTGGRPLSDVFSTSWWLKILESLEGARDAGLYYGRSDWAIRKVRQHALAGNLPQAKVKLPLYRLLLAGHSNEDVARILGRDVEWVRHHAHYLQALIIRRNDGHPVPDLGVPLPPQPVQHAAD